MYSKKVHINTQEVNQLFDNNIDQGFRAFGWTREEGFYDLNILMQIDDKWGPANEKGQFLISKYIINNESWKQNVFLMSPVLNQQIR